MNYLQQSKVEQAVIRSIEDVNGLNTDGVLQVLAMDPTGRVSACSNTELHYILSTSENPEVRRVDTQLVKKQ